MTVAITRGLETRKGQPVVVTRTETGKFVDTVALDKVLAASAFKLAPKRRKTSRYR